MPFISFLLQFVQGYTYICDRLPGLWASEYILAIRLMFKSLKLTKVKRGGGGDKLVGR